MNPSEISTQARGLYETHGSDDIYAAGILKCTLEAWILTAERHRSQFASEAFNKLNAAVMQFRLILDTDESTVRASRINRPILYWIYAASPSDLPFLASYTEPVFELIENTCPESVQREFSRESRLTHHTYYATVLSQILLSAHHGQAQAARNTGTKTDFAQRFQALLRHYYLAHDRTLTDDVATNCLLQ